MKRRWIEAGKDALIVLLLLSATLMAFYVISPRPLAELPGIAQIASLLGLEDSEALLAEKQVTVTEAVRPIALSVRTENGRESALYDFTASDSMYESLGRWLGEALGTADAAEEITEDAWTEILSCTGVYYRFPGSVPLGALANWLGTDLYNVPEGTVAEAFAVALDGDSVVLGYMTDDGFFLCQTQVSGSSLYQALTEFGADGSMFAFEGTEDYAQLSGVDSCSLISLSDIVMPRVETVSSLSAEDAATGLGFNPYGESSYTMTDGTRVFSETGSRLLISGSRIIYTSTSGQFTADEDTDTTLTETARALLEALTENRTGDARLYLTGFERSDSQTVLTFSYLIAGIPVELSDGEAAVVTFNGTELTDLELDFRSFTILEDTFAVLPALQAAALTTGGGQLALVYVDTGEQALSGGWQAGD